MIAKLEGTYWYQIFALDSAVIEVQYKKCSAHMEAFLLLQCIIMEKHSNQINTLWWNKEKGSRHTDSQS